LTDPVIGFLLGCQPEAGEALRKEAMLSLERVMESGRRKAISPEKVAEVVLKAVEAKRTKSRYGVGAGARMAVIGSFLPDCFTDWVISKIFSRKFPSRTLEW